MSDLNRLGQGAYGAAFAKLYGLDDWNAVPQLAPEILPVSSIWERPELWGLLANGNLLATHQTVTGVAAQRSFVSVCNPAGSQLLVIIERIILNTTDNYQWGMTLSPNGRNVSNTLRDSRLANTTTPIGGGATVQQGTSPTTVITVATGSFTGRAIIDVTHVLAPGTTFALETTANQVNAVFSIEWRERHASDAELLIR